MKSQKYITKVLYVLSALCLLVFFSSSGFRDKITTGGWYQQFFPNLNGCTITSITFVDSLIGYAVTNQNSSVQSYILKTTNGGDNWDINLSTYPNFNKIIFLNVNTGFASAYTDALFKTTNGGANWTLTSNGGIYPKDMAVLNKDTILYVTDNGFDGGVYRTTNGGLNWSPLGPTGGSGQPNIIYMFNKNIGFIDDNVGANRMKKTTNGGVNWFPIANEAFNDLRLIDTITGWRTNGDVKKTTDGGITWNLQQMPQIFVNYINSISISDINNIWGAGGSILKNNIPYGVIYKTTNGGLNWGYQYADTSIHIGLYDIIIFINKYIGWAYRLSSGVHTIVGGNDTTFYTGIKLVEEYVPTGYLLRQNYPNPFNPQTNIPFELSESGYVTLKVYDITGREVKELINGKWGKASYVAEFNAENLASGIYFYRLKFVSDATKKEFIDTKKMMLIK